MRGCPKWAMQMQAHFFAIQQKPVPDTTLLLYCGAIFTDIEGFYALLTYFLLTSELKSNVETRDAVIFILTKETTRIHTRLAVYVPLHPISASMVSIDSTLSTKLTIDCAP